MPIIKWKAQTESSRRAIALMIKVAKGTGGESVAAFTASVAQRDTKQAFVRKKDPNTGESWPARKHSYPHPILRKSGTLWADVFGTYLLTSNGFKASVKIPSGSPAAEYGPIHDKGGTVSRSLGSRSGGGTFWTMPQRRYSGMTPKGRKQVIKFAKARLLGKRQ